MTASQKEQTTPWLLLIHQVPPKPDYLRVKIGRRLQRVGAVAIKNSVYALPERPQSLEDFQWIRAEIVDAGGDASICKAEFVDGLTNDDVVFLFNGARDADYAELAKDAREIWNSVRRRDGASRGEDELARLRKRFAAVGAIDFFGAPGRGMTEQALRAISDGLEPAEARRVESRITREDRSTYRGRTWVTRRGIFVDRIASAWLIRRFIDRDARFRFVDEAKPSVSRGELRFDMSPGEFTHEGDRCTFETLLTRFSLEHAALRAIAEIVHDIDLKDDKFARDDTPGIERVLAGIAASHADDDVRLERGSQLFDDLYALFSAQLENAVE